MWWSFKSRTPDTEEETDDETSSSTDLHPAAARIIELQRASGNYSVQALIAGEQRERLPSQDTNQSPANNNAETDVGQVLADGSSGGHSLDENTRKEMEGRFGADLDDVQIHDDANAETSTNALQARAYTKGRDIYFAPGKYSPTTYDGKKLLAHELTHVVQARESQAPARHISDPSDASEREADSVSSQFSRSPMEPVRATQAPAAAVQRDEWFEEDIERQNERIVFCRPVGQFNTLQQLLRRVEITIYPNPSPKKAPKKGKLPEILKKAPGAEDAEMYIDGRLAFSQWTSKEVQEKIDGLFPPGKPTFVNDSIINKVKKIVEEDRKKHPDVFSMVQGIETATCAAAPESSPTCIGTMNFAVQKLFGPKVIKTEEMGEQGTVLEAIDTVKEKKLTTDEKKFKATYAGSDKRFQILKESDVKFSGAGDWLEKEAQEDGDGLHVFLFSVANGFHSVSLFVLRDGENTTITWKDQHTLVVLTPSEFDEKVRKLCVARFRFWVRDEFNRKYGTDHDSYDDIVNDSRTPEIENALKATVLKDISENLIVKLKPPKAK